MSLYVDIKKQMGNFKLDIKFSVDNEIMSILGASGCGKSMTLKCIAGIETPDEGKIVLGDKILFDSEKKINLPPQKRKIGYLFQNYALFPNMTVEQNIGAGIFLSKNRRIGIVQEKIKAFYLEGLENKYPHQLSGGQQQRVALARILASEPEIIMLDEPFSALDSYLKWQLEQELMELLSNFKGTVLLVSHNRNESYRFSKSIAVVSDGSIEVISEKDALFREPRTLAAALLTGCKNISKAEKRSEHSLYAPEWDMLLYTDKYVPDDIKYVGMRAHYLKYTEDLNLQNTMNCEIVNTIENPFSYIIMLKNKDRSEDKGNAAIRWETDKNIWEMISTKDKPLGLSFKGGDLLLLR